MKAYNVSTKNPQVENARLQQQKAAAPQSITAQRNARTSSKPWWKKSPS